MSTASAPKRCRHSDAPGLDPVDVALPLLLNELRSTNADLVLVLDDYHVLSDPRLHEGVEFFLAYLPPSLRVVLAGRADPPLPLPRLRARGELTEIRMDDLGFSTPESQGTRDIGSRRPARPPGRAPTQGADRGMGSRTPARRA